MLWSFAPLFIMVVVDFLSISPFMMPYDYTLLCLEFLGQSLPRNCGCPQHPQQTPNLCPRESERHAFFLDRLCSLKRKLKAMRMEFLHQSSHAFENWQYISCGNGGLSPIRSCGLCQPTACPQQGCSTFHVRGPLEPENMFCREAKMYLVNCGEWLKQWYLHLLPSNAISSMIVHQCLYGFLAQHCTVLVPWLALVGEISCCTASLVMIIQSISPTVSLLRVLTGAPNQSFESPVERLSGHFHNGVLKPGNQVA